jgi:hypothetical protein
LKSFAPNNLKASPKKFSWFCEDEKLRRLWDVENMFSVVYERQQGNESADDSGT